MGVALEHGSDGGNKCNDVSAKISRGAHPLANVEASLLREWSRLLAERARAVSITVSAYAEMMIPKLVPILPVNNTALLFVRRIFSMVDVLLRKSGQPGLSSSEQGPHRESQKPLSAAHRIFLSTIWQIKETRLLIVFSWECCSMFHCRIRSGCQDRRHREDHPYKPRPTRQTLRVYSPNLRHVVPISMRSLRFPDLMHISIRNRQLPAGFCCLLPRRGAVAHDC